jgi:hypothetical protein
VENFRGKIRYFGAVPMASLSRADMKAIIQSAWVKVGELWHREMRPKHFTQAGAREYDYAPRSGEPGNPHPQGFWQSYTGRKQRYQRHTRPLEWSGELKELTRARRIDAKAFRKRSKMRVIMPQARKANFRHPASEVNMREELTRVSEREVPELVEEHNETMSDRLRLYSGSQTIQVG